MKINWDIKNPVQPRRARMKALLKVCKSVFGNTNVPLHNSSHYRREHFHDDDPLASPYEVDDQFKLF